MPIEVQCPSCGKRLKAPDSAAGRRGKCPQCGTSIVLHPAASAVYEPEVIESEPAEQDMSVLGQVLREPKSNNYELDAPAGNEPAADTINRRPCPMCGEMIPVAAAKCRFCGEVFDSKLKQLGYADGSGPINPAWSKVRTGVAIVYNCIVVIFISAVVLVLVGGIFGASADILHNQASLGILVLFGIACIVIIAAGIGTIVGQLMCAYVPEESGARGLAIGAAICMIIYPLTSFASISPKLKALSALGALASFIGTILFIFFMRKSATFLKNMDLARSCAGFLVFTVVYAAVVVVLAVIAGAAREPGLLALLGLGILVCAVIALVWYLRLLRNLKLTIEERLPKA